MIPRLRGAMQIIRLSPGCKRQKDRRDFGRSRNGRVRDKVTEGAVMIVGALAPADVIHAHAHQGDMSLGRIYAIRRHHGRRHSASHNQEKHSSNADQSMAQQIGHGV
jgi:hypothetical protein|tara:strand:+ start:480 stop:800 length:321 start_codon:yes stop_codon:yes gene_type:complete